MFFNADFVPKSVCSRHARYPQTRGTSEEVFSVLAFKTKLRQVVAKTFFAVHASNAIACGDTIYRDSYCLTMFKFVKWYQEATTLWMSCVEVERFFLLKVGLLLSKLNIFENFLA